MGWSSFLLFLYSSKQKLWIELFTMLISISNTRQAVFFEYIYGARPLIMSIRNTFCAQNRTLFSHFPTSKWDSI